MNYIKHLNNIMILFTEDERLFPSHISLYLALFQFWNLNRFESPILIIRDEVMKVSKIRSRSTYSKCLNELTEFGYIKYRPSRNPMIGSTVDMYNYCTTAGHLTGQDLSNKTTTAGQRLGPSINNINYNKHKHIEREENFPPTLEALKNFFKKKKAEKSLKLDGDTEAQKFHNHYRANGWMIGKNKMQDWQAAAENWILKTIEFNGTNNQNHGNTNHLHTNPNKDYSEPL